MTLNLQLKARMLGALAVVAFVAACGGNGPPATITPDPTNPMNPMGYRIGPATKCPVSTTTCAAPRQGLNR